MVDDVRPELRGRCLPPYDQLREHHAGLARQLTALADDEEAAASELAAAVA